MQGTLHPSFEVPAWVASLSIGQTVLAPQEQQHPNGTNEGIVPKKKGRCSSVSHPLSPLSSAPTYAKCILTGFIQSNTQAKVHFPGTELGTEDVTVPIGVLLPVQRGAEHHYDHRPGLLSHYSLTREEEDNHRGASLDDSNGRSLEESISFVEEAWSLTANDKMLRSVHLSEWMHQHRAKGDDDRHNLRQKKDARVCALWFPCTLHALLHDAQRPEDPVEERVHSESMMAEDRSCFEAQRPLGAFQLNSASYDVFLRGDFVSWVLFARVPSGEQSNSPEVGSSSSLAQQMPTVRRRKDTFHFSFRLLLCDKFSSLLEFRDDAEHALYHFHSTQQHSSLKNGGDDRSSVDLKSSFFLISGTLYVMTFPGPEQDAKVHAILQNALLKYFGKIHAVIVVFLVLMDDLLRVTTTTTNAQQQVDSRASIKTEGPTGRSPTTYGSTTQQGLFSNRARSLSRPAMTFAAPLTQTLAPQQTAAEGTLFGKKRSSSIKLEQDSNGTPNNGRGRPCMLDRKLNSDDAKHWVRGFALFLQPQLRFLIPQIVALAASHSSILTSHLFEDRYPTKENEEACNGSSDSLEEGGSLSMDGMTVILPKLFSHLRVDGPSDSTDSSIGKWLQLTHLLAPNALKTTLECHCLKEEGVVVVSQASNGSSNHSNASSFTPVVKTREVRGGTTSASPPPMDLQMGSFVGFYFRSRSRPHTSLVENLLDSHTANQLLNKEKSSCDPLPTTKTCNSGSAATWGCCTPPILYSMFPATTNRVRPTESHASTTTPAPLSDEIEFVSFAIEQLSDSHRRLTRFNPDIAFRNHVTIGIVFDDTEDRFKDGVGEKSGALLEQRIRNRLSSFHRRGLSDWVFPYNKNATELEVSFCVTLLSTTTLRDLLLLEDQQMAGKVFLGHYDEDHTTQNRTKEENDDDEEISYSCVHPNNGSGGKGGRRTEVSIDRKSCTSIRSGGLEPTPVGGIRTHHHHQRAMALRGLRNFLRSVTHIFGLGQSKNVVQWLSQSLFDGTFPLMAHCQEDLHRGSSFVPHTLPSMDTVGPRSTSCRFPICVVVCPHSNSEDPRSQPAANTTEGSIVKFLLHEIEFSPPLPQRVSADHSSACIRSVRSVVASEKLKMLNEARLLGRLAIQGRRAAAAIGLDRSNSTNLHTQGSIELHIPQPPSASALLHSRMESIFLVDALLTVGDECRRGGRCSESHSAGTVSSAQHTSPYIYFLRQQLALFAQIELLHSQHLRQAILSTTEFETRVVQIDHHRALEEAFRTIERWSSLCANVLEPFALAAILHCCRHQNAVTL